MARVYRTDIDGLRALAVITVIFFHLGYLTNGYLGVDVFFAISGYLITGILYNEVEENRFSLFHFYERRWRRIIPLVLLTTLTAFVLGLIFMLPDDLENLCQSVFASNFFANNILMKITSSNYWAVRNNYKPLMHTWSLGVEEQFYLLYPSLFFLLKGKWKRYILPAIVLLTVLSLGAFVISDNMSSKFYFLQYRFYELSIGGICAIYFKEHHRLKTFKGSRYFLYIFLALLVALLCSNVIKSNDVKVFTTIILTSGILVWGGVHFQSNRVYKALLSNKLFRGIGKISYSLYMWHQIILAFARYAFVEVITWPSAIVIGLISVVLSIITYFTVENYFRNRKKVKLKPLAIITGISFVLITGSAFYVYMIGGIIKDVPELGLKVSNRPKQLNFFSGQDNINIHYNEEIRNLDKPFSDENADTGQTFNKIKILVLGNSFGRDVANILLASSFRDTIEVRYSDLVATPAAALKRRIADADYVFFGSDYPSQSFIHQFGIDMQHTWMVGYKDFGNSNGIHYNRHIKDYRSYRTAMKKGTLEKDRRFKSQWGNNYIDLIDLVANNQGKVLVFTPDGKFISQDTRHLTKFGARFFAKLLNKKFRKILKLPNKQRKRVNDRPLSLPFF